MSVFSYRRMPVRDCRTAAFRISNAACLALLLFAVAGCRSYPTYPITQHSRPFSELDASSSGTAPNVAANVSSDRIVRARSEPQNWLTYYGTYDGQRFSSLNQINRGNVAILKTAWVFQAGVIGLIANPATYSFEAAPIVVDGVMYVSGWDGYVWALNAATGEQYWRFRYAVPLDVPLCCGNVNRGVAVARGKVFVVTLNGHLLALDAVTGRLLWDVTWADVRAAESATLAPLVVKDMVIVGSSGAEYGVRGHIDAFDLETGQRRWRRYNVPAPGEPGSETWPNTDASYRGGGSAWITGTYDPDLDLLYWGTGNPSPDFDGGVRPGNNLHTSAVVALDPDDGALRWYYQWTPHDVWDYDGVNENILFERDGRRLLGHFDKNGYFFVLDRTNGQLVTVAPFARATWGQISPSGQITRLLEPTPEGVDICPGPAGAKEWPHAAYSRETGLFYTPLVELCATFSVRRDVFKEGMAYWGGDAKPRTTDYFGGVKAIDPANGREVWFWRHAHPTVASVLATAGGLVFVGAATGEFVALDARTGREMWSFQTGSGIHSSPVTYSVGGKQYVAVATGWGGWVKGYAPELYGQQRGSALFVFALP